MKTREANLAADRRRVEKFYSNWPGKATGTTGETTMTEAIYE